MTNSKYAKRYAIVEAKKADLDSLSNRVQIAQYEVSELQSVVTSLEQKSNEFTVFLSEAQASKETALSNLNLLKATLSNVDDLARNAAIGMKQSRTADKTVNTTSKQVSKLIDQLIYSGDMVNKFAQLVFKKKLLNPLISDELVKTVTTANADVNNAIAATLTALQSCFASNGVTGESAKLCRLQQKQAQQLSELMSVGLNQSQIIHIPTIKTLLDDISKAEGLISKTLIGVDDPVRLIFENISKLEKELDSLQSTDADLYKALIKLDQERENTKDPAKLKELEAQYKQAESALNSNHRKRESVQAKLVAALKSAQDETISVKSAQDWFIECQDDANSALSLLKKQKGVVTSLTKAIEAEKNPALRNALKLDLLSEKRILLNQITINAILKTKLDLAERQVATANSKFADADAQLVAANTKLKDVTAQAVGTKSLLALLIDCYTKAVIQYKHDLRANNLATKELDHAQASLATATNKLSSLQAGLSAATAAALAA